MAKQTPNYLDQETVTKAVPVLTKLFDSMSFFYTRLKDHPQEEDMQTHMRLFESYFSELSDLFGYHSNATEKRNKLFANLRDERKRLEEDKKRFANTTSPIQVTACLKRYEDIFTAWYESNGFHYANLQKTMNHGFLFDVSDELEKEQDCNLTSDNEFFTWCCQRFCKIQDHTSCDFYANAYHDNLLDTDTNKKILQQILQIFPSASIHNFHTIHDKNRHYLRWTVYVSFGDLEQLYQTYLQEREQTND